MSWNRACVYVDKRKGIEVVSSRSLQTLQLYRGDGERRRRFVRMKMSVFLRIAPTSFSRSVVTRRSIVVTTVSWRARLHGAYIAPANQQREKHFPLLRFVNEP